MIQSILQCIGRIVQRVVLMTTGLGLAAAAAGAQNVAMVTDVKGKVTGPVAVAILSEIPVDARLMLESEAQLVAIYLASGDEYTFSGPSHIQFSAGAPKVLSGVLLQKRASPLGNIGNVTIRPVAVAQAGFVTRSEPMPIGHIKLLSLSGTKALESSPEFRWQAIQPGVKYHFELADDAGRLLYEAESEVTALVLPAAVELLEGVSYAWEVSARSSDGGLYVGTGEFRIASADLRTLAAASRPPMIAPVSERVAYAAWLEQVELRDEARKFWRALSLERPDEAKLKALAVE